MICLTGQLKHLVRGQLTLTIVAQFASHISTSDRFDPVFGQKRHGLFVDLTQIGGRKPDLSRPTALTPAINDPAAVRDMAPEPALICFARSASKDGPCVSVADVQP